MFRHQNKQQHSSIAIQQQDDSSNQQHFPFANNNNIHNSSQLAILVQPQTLLQHQNQQAAIVDNYSRADVASSTNNAQDSRRMMMTSAATMQTSTHHHQQQQQQSTKCKPKSKSSLNLSIRRLIRITLHRNNSTSNNNNSNNTHNKDAANKHQTNTVGATIDDEVEDSDVSSNTAFKSNTTISVVGAESVAAIGAVNSAANDLPASAAKNNTANNDTTPLKRDEQRQQQQQQQQHAKYDGDFKQLSSLRLSEGSTTTTTATSNKQECQSFNDSNHSHQLNSDTTPMLDVEHNNHHQNQSSLNLKNLEECPLCVIQIQKSEMIYGASCMHRVCQTCMKKYISVEINHSRLNITCPVCPFYIHPNTVKRILQDEDLYNKYENFMLRRVIAAEPDARWCPAPDCGFAVIASGCNSCPEIKCQRDGCNTSFCYHCKQIWHPNETCFEAKERVERSSASNLVINDYLSESWSRRYSEPMPAVLKNSRRNVSAEEIRECPICGSKIIKMNDGSCNHMKCSICETEFCWLCMKEITDLHYFSPSGCTFWGRRPWSRKKKILWQLGMLVGAPVCIVLIAGVAIPAIVIGIPVWAGRKLRDRLEREHLSRYRKNAIVTTGVLASLLVSPIISAVALAVGIPILLGYVYGVVPISLCRTGGCGLTSTESSENLNEIASTEKKVVS